MIKSKKASNHLRDIFILLLLAVVVIYIYSILVSKNDLQNKQFGELQKSIIESYSAGEKILLYADQASKMSAWSAIIETAAIGGYKSQCGTFNGYTLWLKIQSGTTTECFPDTQKAM